MSASLLVLAACGAPTGQATGASTGSPIATAMASARSPSPSPKATETVTGVTQIELPDLGGNLVVVGETLWAGGEKLLMELDPQTGQAIRRSTPDYNAVYLAATQDAIWATDTARSTVRRIDPSDGHVVATIEVPSTPKGTTLGEGSVWIACDGAATVVRIDTTTNEVAAEIAVEKGLTASPSVADRCG